MASHSAGILLFRRRGGELEVLLVHPGGPFWAKKDIAAWSIPKGEYAEGEEPLAAAMREFAEELGQPAPAGDLVSLGEARQASGKRVMAWALAGDFDVLGLHSNLFEMEWPPHSGRRVQFPEIDRAVWFGLRQAATKIVPAQQIFLDKLALLSSERSGASS